MLEFNVSFFANNSIDFQHNVASQHIWNQHICNGNLAQHPIAIWYDPQQLQWWQQSCLKCLVSGTAATAYEGLGAFPGVYPAFSLLHRSECMTSQV